MHPGNTHRGRTVCCFAAHPVEEPKVFFSGAIIPECYKVHKEWCEELERELASVFYLQLGTDPNETTRVLRYARTHHASARLFLNPGRLLARLQHYKVLEGEFTGLSIRRIFVRNPMLVTHTTQSLRHKLNSLLEILQLSKQDSKLGKCVGRCPSLLSRSLLSIWSTLNTLQSLLGEEAALHIVVLYPEVFSRGDDTLRAAHASLRATLGLDGEAMRSFLKINPGLITRNIQPDKLEAVVQATNLPVQQVRPCKCMGSARMHACLSVASLFPKRPEIACSRSLPGVSGREAVPYSWCTVLFSESGA